MSLLSDQSVVIRVLMIGGGMALGLGALLLGFDACEEDAPPENDRVVAERPAPASPGAGRASTPSDPATDPLCALHADLVDAVDAAGPAGTPTALEASIRAQIGFYGAAATVVEDADAAAFVAMAEYFDAWRRFHEPRGWNPQVDLSEAAQIPVAPPGAGTRTAEVLSDRCGVTAAPDNPG
jgi:hypothetical protein